MEDWWQYALRNHPDREFGNYIVEGISSGFWVNFQGTVRVRKPTMKNMRSAFQCERNIDEFLAAEYEAGRILGPFERITSRCCILTD